MTTYEFVPHAHWMKSKYLTYGTEIKQRVYKRPRQLQHTQKKRVGSEEEYGLVLTRRLTIELALIKVKRLLVCLPSAGTVQLKVTSEAFALARFVKVAAVVAGYNKVSLYDQ